MVILFLSLLGWLWGVGYRRECTIIGRDDCADCSLCAIYKYIFMVISPLKFSTGLVSSVFVLNCIQYSLSVTAGLASVLCLWLVHVQGCGSIDCS